jgi:hypothetical protein
VIPFNILEYWRAKYKEYLWMVKTDNLVIFFENGRLDCFHPSGDRLAIYSIKDNKTMYWANNKALTEKEYINYLLLTE